MPKLKKRASAKVNMKTKLFCATTIACLAGMNCPADDITTLDGQKYENVRDIRPSPEGLFFIATQEGSIKGVKVSFTNLNDEIKKKYNYDPFEYSLYTVRQNRPMNLKLNNAYRLSNLDAAKKKAKEEHKMIGFIMVWDMMFQPSQPMGSGGPNDLAGFYVAFNKALVLVFVRHEDELDKVPDAVKKGFFGPDEGGFAPNMAVVTEDCSQFICEIPLGGNNSNGYVREQIFRKKIAEIKKFVADREPAKSQPK
jgi:hypothetical protein